MFALLLGLCFALSPVSPACSPLILLVVLCAQEEEDVSIERQPAVPVPQTVTQQALQAEAELRERVALLERELLLLKAQQLPQPGQQAPPSSSPPQQPRPQPPPGKSPTQQAVDAQRQGPSKQQQGATGDKQRAAQAAAEAEEQKLEQQRRQKAEQQSIEQQKKGHQEAQEKAKREAAQKEQEAQQRARQKEKEEQEKAHGQQQPSEEQKARERQKQEEEEGRRWAQEVSPFACMGVLGYSAWRGCGGGFSFALLHWLSLCEFALLVPFCLPGDLRGFLGDLL